MANPHGINVGDSVYVVPPYSDQRHRTCRVAKVGRKWATLEGWPEERFDLETLNCERLGRVYVSKAHYAVERDKSRWWAHLYRRVRVMSQSHLPASVTLNDIKSACARLGIEGPDAE
jgi:hypothetical protein